MSRPGRVIFLKTITERMWRQQVLTWAKTRGWLVYFTWSSMHSIAGFPDLVLVRPPRLIMAELKREGGKPTKTQAHWIDRLSSCPGVEVYIWRPSDEDQVLEVLKTNAEEGPL